MFITKNSRGITEQTADIEQAIRWHNEGRFVFIAGWVKAQKQNKLRDLSTEKFKDILKFHPRWKITTAPAIPATPRYRYYGGRAISIANKEEVKAKAKEILKPKNKKAKQKKQTRGLHCGKKRKPVVTALAASTVFFNEMKSELLAKGKPITTIKLYHGTSLKNIEPILLEGFKLKSYGGMLGRGVYAGKVEKAVNYSQGSGLLLEVVCLLGSCKELDKVENLYDTQNMKYDSMHIGPGKRDGVFKGFLRNEEWVFRDPRQIKVVGVVDKGW